MNRVLLLLLHRMEGLHPAEKLKLLQTFPAIEDWKFLQWQDLEAALGRRMADRGPSLAQRLALSESDCIDLEKHHQDFFIYGKEGYPVLLGEIPDPPLLVFYRGIPRNAPRYVAVVGTRHPTQAAQQAAFELGARLASLGWVVVSGLAFGIDRQAHRGALVHGITWAWLASSVENITPKAHVPLARAILDGGGLILSEHPPGTPALRHHFPRRNRLLSGQCQAVILVQAPRKSGAMITARLALEQNREVLVLREGLHPVAGSGGLALAEEGARVIDVSANLEKEAAGWMP